MNPGHFRWPTNANIPLFLELEGTDNLPVSGKTPKVAVQRYREIQGGFLDNYYWDGAAFVATPTLLDMTELSQPGVYVYYFQQALVGLEHQYIVSYTHDVFPVGFATETHLITNEVYIPSTQPDPIIVGPESVMGQLELMKDGGTGDFDGLTDSLHFLRFDIQRVLGLLHYNAMLDKQEYDTNNQLTYARLRVFDEASNIPTDPGGSETTGLEQEYEIRAAYAGLGVVTKFVLEKVL